jgi:NADH:ubiquinone oxidoreductase subunit E
MPSGAPAQGRAKIYCAFIDSVVAERSHRPGALLGILQRVQEHDPNHYLSAPALEYIAAKTAAPLSQV